MMIPANDLRLRIISSMAPVTKAIGLKLGIIRSKRNRTRMLTSLAESHKDKPKPVDVCG